LYAKILVQYGILNMEVHLSPEFEAELKRIASERGCLVDQFVQEIVEAYLDHGRWFRAEVQKGLAQLDDGERVSHDEVVASIKRMFQL
jgi:predicted transcriptional regulator